MGDESEGDLAEDEVGRGVESKGGRAGVKVGRRAESEGGQVGDEVGRGAESEGGRAGSPCPSQARIFTSLPFFASQRARRLAPGA